eukprot:TRINITY_DN66788_c1_g1_i2.p1 TRINITY_DN66788_c1_g1~~TRINITY_DN66788_c1_g1_i2.p1  ORF type:complete len:182 (-),score=13.55 TRINITY_DN66788_c1_g1_i2:258-803(-)
MLSAQFSWLVKWLSSYNDTVQTDLLTAFFGAPNVLGFDFLAPLFDCYPQLAVRKGRLILEKNTQREGVTGTIGTSPFWLEIQIVEEDGTLGHWQQWDMGSCLPIYEAPTCQWVNKATHKEDHEFVHGNAKCARREKGQIGTIAVAGVDTTVLWQEAEVVRLLAGGPIAPSYNIRRAYRKVD